MKTYLINYETGTSKAEFESLFTAIKKHDSWWHCHNQTWIIRSQGSTNEIKNFFEEFIEKKDKLNVQRIS